MRFTVFTAALLFALSSPSFAADDTAKTYSIKQEQPDTGSHIRQNVVQNSPIPVDKTYAQLSPEQQGYVKSLYEAMGPNDEPPFPLHGLAPIYKALATGQQKMYIAGDLSLVVEVDSKGEPTSVAIHKSPDPEMAKFAASVLMLQKYKPALCKGEPCKMQFPFRITFQKQL